MIATGRRVPVYAYGAPVDMRKSFDTLGALVREQIAVRGRDAVADAWQGRVERQVARVDHGD